MNPIQLSSEAKQFLNDSAEHLKNEDQVCTLITYGPNTSYNGKVLGVSEGGLTFLESDTGRQIMTPWEYVEKFVTIPVIAQSAVEPEQTRAAASGKR